ncbi:MAG: glutamate--tRNA ligase [Myxococcota bacterium]|nr:glutamate--tRNA ligase [Myxococcota bacterium]
MNVVRTRVAPSPTGDPHVGTAYVALFNYCLAKKHGGQFILRIEDTDQQRSTPQSEQQIIEALRWVGIEWDEGPDVGGPHGPYRQSERADIYRQYAQKLLEEGHAFRCFLTPEELAELRAQHQAAGAVGALDSPYAQISADESAERAAQGQPFVIRMRVPREGICTVNDHLRGTVDIPWSQVDMQVLLKSDGLPTYHLANVVDDHLMGITHVLRGEEWISSAPKHLLLYRYFGWTPPVLCHLPLLRNPDKSKLSKRKNPTSILYYQRMGYLPEGLLNYLGRMAWSMPDESERFDLPTMVSNFDLSRISLGGPVFDTTKLDWLNGLWIRESLNDDEFADRVQRWALNREYLKPIIPLVRTRVNKWSDLTSMASFFVDGTIPLSADDLVFKGLETDDVRRVYAWTLWALDPLADWHADTIQKTMRHMASVMGLKLRIFLAPFFMAATGKRSATPLFETLAILGKDLTRARIRNAIDTIKPLSGKEQKRWKAELDKALAVYNSMIEQQSEKPAGSG